MSDRDVKTIRDLLYYQYAKIIARRLQEKKPDYKPVPPGAYAALNRLACLLAVNVF